MDGTEPADGAGRTDAPALFDADLLRPLVPAVIGVLLRRGADFASAEDAVQEALLSAVRTRGGAPPRDPKGWLITVSWRRFLDATRSDAARRGRELTAATEPAAGPVPAQDDTLHLYFLCAHPALSPAAAAALTLRAVGGLSTRQIASAFLVPESTMAQRITRAKRRIAGLPLDTPGDAVTVLRVLYLVFNAGYDGDERLSREAIRLTRRLAALRDDPETSGLLALMMLHEARRLSRSDGLGRLVPLRQQDRRLWDTAMIDEAVRVLQGALARDDLGPYQAQAAIAALHADAPSVADTDWVQIVEWYDELLRLTDSPVVRLNRAVAVGESDGPQAGLAALERVDAGLPRYEAVAAYLRERTGDADGAADLYARAARRAASIPERDHLIRESARVRQAAAHRFPTINESH